jgi:hypothetical protein
VAATKLPYDGLLGKVNYLPDSLEIGIWDLSNDLPRRMLNLYFGRFCNMTHMFGKPTTRPCVCLILWRDPIRIEEGYNRALKNSLGMSLGTARYQIVDRILKWQNFQPRCAYS